MQARFKRIGTPLLAILLLAGLVAAAYATTSNPDNQIEQKQNVGQTIGKNWRVGGTIRSSGQPVPLKNLKATADPASDKAIIESRFDPSEAQIRPSESAQ